MFAVDHAHYGAADQASIPFCPAGAAARIGSGDGARLGCVQLSRHRADDHRTDGSQRRRHSPRSCMPYSHLSRNQRRRCAACVARCRTGVRAALALGRAIGIGIVSHLVLDLITHAADIAVWPGLSSPTLGLGLYDRAPMWGFGLELVYGVFCWWVYRGNRPLLAIVVLGNLANLSFFSAAIPGPEEYLARTPTDARHRDLLRIVTMRGWWVCSPNQ